MSDVKALKSYLVGLGFKVDNKQYRDFEGALAGAARSVKSQTVDIASNLLKWQTGIIGLFATVSGAILGTLDKVAMADQDFRLFGERMFMSTQNARSLKIAMDALGQPLEAIAFDPELHGRFMQLQSDQTRMYKSLGMTGENDEDLRRIRDVEFEFTRFKVELQAFLFGTAKEISKALFGDGDVLKHLRGINEWIITNIPNLSKQFANFLVPILKDTWRILKDVGELIGFFANEFTNLVSLLSGDDSISSTAFSFEKFAMAVEKTVGFVANLVDGLVKLERYLPLLETLGGAAVGGAIGSVIPGVGTAIGAGVGGAVGLLGGSLARLKSPGASVSAQSFTDGASGGSVNADAARELANRISGDTGIPADILFAQFAHETGNFTNRGASSLNNLAGIRLPGSSEYRSFDSLDDFAKYYEGQLRKNYSGTLSARNTDDFAKALKNGRIGSWYGDSLGNYQRGMRNFEPQYYSKGDGSSTSVTIGEVNIANPNANAQEIATELHSQIEDKQYKQTQRNLTELQTVFQ
jgi:hypothetical protein